MLSIWSSDDCMDSGPAVKLCLSLPICFFQLVWSVSFLLTGMANCSFAWCGFHLSGDICLKWVGVGHSQTGDEVGRGGSGLRLWDPNFFLTGMACTSTYFSILN